MKSSKYKLFQFDWIDRKTRDTHSTHWSVALYVFAFLNETVYEKMHNTLWDMYKSKTTKLYNFNVYNVLKKM